MRYCEDIGLHVVDRSILKSCKHRTSYCSRKCYNLKLQKAFDIFRADDRLEYEWLSVATKMPKMLSRRGNPERIRLVTRGEAFSTLEDIPRVEQMLRENPETLFWIPTRSWMDSTLRTHVTRLREWYPNAVIMASLDPSNTTEQAQDLRDTGWSLMFFGNDTEAPLKGFMKCPKTWGKLKGTCKTCATGCFSRADVWLKEH